MPRHTESLAVLPGVEYEISTEQLFIDVGLFLDADEIASDERVIGQVILAVMVAWRKNMPHRHVREYVVRGAG
jgi:hypothetical protein